MYSLYVVLGGMNAAIRASTLIRQVEHNNQSGSKNSPAHFVSTYSYISQSCTKAFSHVWAYTVCGVPNSSKYLGLGVNQCLYYNISPFLLLVFLSECWCSWSRSVHAVLIKTGSGTVFYWMCCSI